MITIHKMLQMIDESSFHSSKNHIIKAEARRIIKLLCNNCQEEVEELMEWYDEEILDEDDEKPSEIKDEIMNSPFLSAYFTFLVMSACTGPEQNNMCNPLELITIFEQKRGQEEFELAEVRFIIGASKNEGEFQLEDDEPSILLYIKRGKIRKEYKRRLYELLKSRKGINSFKELMTKVESVLAHELQHAWNHYEGEKQTGSYIGNIEWYNDLKQLFPFIEKFSTYDVDPDEMNSRYSEAYTMWRKSYKAGKRRSFLDIYSKQQWKCSFNDAESWFIETGEGEYYLKMLGKLYELYVFLPSKRGFQQILNNDPKKEQYEDLKDLLIDDVELASKVIPNLVTLFQYVQEKYPEMVPSENLKRWQDYYDDRFYNRDNDYIIKNGVGDESFVKNFKKYL